MTKLKKTTEASRGLLESEDERMSGWDHKSSNEVEIIKCVTGGRGNFPYGNGIVNQK